MLIFLEFFNGGGVIYLTISVLLHFLNKKVLFGRIRRRNSGFQSRFAVVDIRYRIADYNADDLRRESGVDVTSQIYIRRIEFRELLPQFHDDIVIYRVYDLLQFFFGRGIGCKVRKEVSHLFVNDLLLRFCIVSFIERPAELVEELEAGQHQFFKLHLLSLLDGKMFEDAVF